MKKLVLLFAASMLAVMFAQTAIAQNEKEINLESNSSSRSRTIYISRSGSYRLPNDHSVRDGDGIVITASNVTLNLNGNTVSTAANGTGRGIAVEGGSGVQIRNGRVGGFNSNVMVLNSTNVNVESLQIVGEGLAPNNGPSEIGVLIVNSQNVFVSRNNISSVNLGIFVRGGSAAGNRIFENLVVGGKNPANNLLGICYNPAAGAGPNGPRGDNIYNNQIVRFNYGIAISAGSQHNIFNENNLSSFTRGFRELEALVINGGTNVSDGNLETVVPAEVLP
jgi:hypothetical protein